MQKAQKLFDKLRCFAMAWQINFEPPVVPTSSCQIAVADMLLVMDLVHGWQLGSKNLNRIFINCVPSGYDIHSSPWFFDGPNRNRCFTSSKVWFSMAMSVSHKEQVIMIQPGKDCFIAAGEIPVPSIPMRNTLGRKCMSQASDILGLVYHLKSKDITQKYSKNIIHHVFLQHSHGRL